jgi:hypothetical protein
MFISMRVDRFFLRVEEKTLPLHGGRRWSLPTWPYASVRLPPPGPTKTGLFHGVPRKTHWGGALGRLLFVVVEPHSLSGGGGQHRGRRTGTWPRGLHLAEPPPKVAGHPCNGDEAATKTRKAEAGDGGRRRKAGGAFIKKVRMCK